MRAGSTVASGQLLPIGGRAQASSLLSRTGILPILQRSRFWANEGSAPSEPPERSEVDLSFRPQQRPVGRRESCLRAWLPSHLGGRKDGKTEGREASHIEWPMLARTNKALLVVLPSFLSFRPSSPSVLPLLPSFRPSVFPSFRLTSALPSASPPPPGHPPACSLR